MLRYGNKLIMTAAAVAAAGVMGTTGAIAATAATQPARAGASGTETFQAMSTSATAATTGVIASGVFTAPGVDHENQKSATFVFSNGTVTVKHSPGSGHQSVNKKTCLVTINLHGTWKAAGGTGKYAGITGGGTYQLSILGIAARSGGKCSLNATPLAFQQVLRATGHVRL